jgi:hypothetical protein
MIFVCWMSRRDIIGSTTVSVPARSLPSSLPVACPVAAQADWGYHELREIELRHGTARVAVLYVM